MNKALRKAIIAGNWKMNKNRKEAAELIEALKPIAADKTCGVIICVPFTNLETALRLTEGTNIEVGAENVHFEEKGAFTGEISADMLTEMGVKYVIVGHSERRQYFGETDETVRKRTTAALKAGMTVILCVGETLEERELGITEEVVAKQVKLLCMTLAKSASRMSSSLMNRYGQLVLVRLQPQNRRKKFAVSSGRPLLVCLVRQLLTA